MEFYFRFASAADIDALLALEQQCFNGDRLTQRNFQWMISRAHASFIVAEHKQRLVGYALVLYHRGTSLARLYSIAIDIRTRGSGLGEQLLQRAQTCAVEHDCAYLRLEVRSDNLAAIKLYERHGYRRFAVIDDYYEDHAEAIRYEKRVLSTASAFARKVPYYPQTTEFTCGTACLMMAMAALQPGRALLRQEEIQLWREATTIFMTAGHGGCSPHGLALAAWRRGFRVSLQVSHDGPLFLDGVRSESKKDIMRLVDQSFRKELAETDVEQVRGSSVNLQRLLSEGGRPVVLISSYRLTRSKSPHWVLVTDCDEDFVYLHDPEIDHSQNKQAIDCQHVPVSHAEFFRMSSFGGNRLRASVILFARTDS